MVERSIVRRFACPGCGNRDLLERVERAFTYAQITCRDDEVVIADRDPISPESRQEVAILCRACGWLHDRRYCMVPISDVLAGKGGCKHD